MAGTLKVARVAGISLALALGGAATVVPVAGAQPALPKAPAAAVSAAPVISSSSAAAPAVPAVVAPVVSTPSSAAANAPAPAPAPAKSGDSAKSFVDGAKALAGLMNDTAGGANLSYGGTGTSGATYNSDGWTYTALAYNPTNDRIYAISKADNDKPAGHLLRIAALNGALTDLGPITLKDGDATKVRTAAFTADGTLVLIDGGRIYTKDFANDESESRTGVDFGAPIRRTGDDIAEYGRAASWASAPSDANTLVSLALNDDHKPFLWTLNATTGEATASPVVITGEQAKQLEVVKTLSYAYPQAGGAFVFADPAGRTVTVKNGQVTSVSTTANEDSNLEGIAGGSIASASPKTGVVKPDTPPQSAANQGNVSKPVNNAEPNTQRNASEEWVKDLNVYVGTADDKFIEGAEFSIDGGKVKVRKYLGEGNYQVQVQLDKAPVQGKLLDLELKEVPSGYAKATATFTPENDSAAFNLPVDPKATTTTNLPDRILAGINEAQSVISSVAKPLGAAAAVGAASKAGRGSSTRTTSTSTTSYTATRMTGRSTTAANATSARSNSTGSTRVVSNASTTATYVSERDDDLADTGTPMRAIMSLGILAMLVGAAYMSLGRRRES